MSTYDDSSLFLYPSGYKASVLFAQKPMDANGQLAFTRSNDTATRVASNGLIEKVRTNLVPNGLSFFAATGVLYTTVTSDSPISGVSSTRITKNEAAGTLRYGNQSVSASVLTGSISYTISRYFKYDGYNLTTSMEYNSSLNWGGTSWVQNIDIASTGVTLQAPSNCTSKITNVGNGWYRVDVTVVNGASPSGSPVTHLLKVDSTLSTGQGFLTAAPQLETGDIATDYILTTTAAVSVGPLANIPRIDYLGGGCGKLLLEPQRTNLVTFSEQIDNAAWGKTNATITANASPSPDGYQNADLFVPASGTTGRVEQATSTASANNTTYTGSVYFKKPTLAIDNITFYISDGSSALGSNRFGITVNLTNFTGTAFNFGNGVTTSVNVVSVGNDWYRAIFTGSVTSGATGNWAFAVRVLTTNATINGTNGLLIWGAQLEAGAYATSYIPTLAASVTRGGDTCSKTGISSLIGQTEGTLFLDFIFKTPSQNTGGQIGISDPTSPFDRVLIWNNFTLNTLAANLQANGSTIFSISLGTFVDGQQYKIALAYKSGSSAAYVNGTQISTNSSTFTFSSTMTNFILGAYETTFMEAHQLTNQALLFKTRLPNSELAALTAL